MRQVATLAGVGLKSVSRVINDEPNVSPVLRAKVEAAIASLDYQPNLQAGSLRRSGGRSHTIGLVVSSVANPFASVLHRGVEDAAARISVAVLAASGDDDTERERAIVAALVRRRVDGLVMTCAGPDQAYLLREIERGTPVVFVDRRPVGVQADAVLSDNEEGVGVAIRHLLAQGHQRIAYLGDRRDIRTAQERRAGFEHTMGQAGIALNQLIIVEDLHDQDTAQAAVEHILAMADPPTALFASQNLVTEGAIRALRKLGLQHKVALIGYDDVPFADLLDPAITVIAQDPQRMGEIAMQRLAARLDGDQSPSRIHLVPTTLIARGSGEIPPTVVSESAN